MTSVVGRAVRFGSLHRWVVGLGTVLLLLCSPAVVDADLEGDVERLDREWQAHGRVTRLGPRQPEGPGMIPLVLPAWATESQTRDCAHLVVLGTRSSVFTLELTEVSTGAPSRIPSQLGLASVWRCGEQKRDLLTVGLESRSDYAIYELLVAAAPRPLPSPIRTLPGRDPGPLAANPDPGPRPVNPPLAARVSLLERVHERRGALGLTFQRVEAESEDSRQLLYRLHPGCHEFHALGPGGLGADLDLELSRVTLTPQSELLDVAEPPVTDSSEAADARVSICNVEERMAIVVVHGLDAAVLALVAHARYPLPEGLPAAWSPSERQELAALIHERRPPPLPAVPGLQVRGISGETDVWLSVVPGVCYFAALVAGGGPGSQLSLEIESGSVARAQGNGAVGVTFCPHSSRARANLVERGSREPVRLALYRVSGPHGSRPDGSAGAGQ